MSEAAKTIQAILIIEDEVAVADLYSQKLIEAGYQVTLESDGQKGLDLAKTGEFNLIVLDIMLPGLSGLDILKQLRESSSPASQTKVIVITNLEQRATARAEVERQVQAYLIKADTTPRQLVEIIQSLH